MTAEYIVQCIYFRSRKSKIFENETRRENKIQSEEMQVKPIIEKCK